MTFDALREREFVITRLPLLPPFNNCSLEKYKGYSCIVDFKNTITLVHNCLHHTKTCQKDWMIKI